MERAAQEIMRMQRVARCLRNRDYSKHRYLYSQRSELNQNEGVIIPRSPTMDEDGKTQGDAMGPTEQNNLTAGQTSREEIDNADRMETQGDDMGPTEQSNLTAGETAREQMDNADRIEIVATSVVTHE